MEKQCQAMKIRTQMPSETDDQDHAAHGGPNGRVIVEDPALDADLQGLGGWRDVPS